MAVAALVDLRTEKKRRTRLTQRVIGLPLSYIATLRHDALLIWDAGRVKPVAVLPTPDVDFWMADEVNGRLATGADGSVVVFGLPGFEKAEVEAFVGTLEGRDEFSIGRCGQDRVLVRRGDAVALVSTTPLSVLTLAKANAPTYSCSQNGQWIAETTTQQISLFQTDPWKLHWKKHVPPAEVDYRVVFSADDRRLRIAESAVFDVQTGDPSSHPFTTAPSPPSCTSKATGDDSGWYTDDCKLVAQTDEEGAKISVYDNRTGALQAKIDYQKETAAEGDLVVGGFGGEPRPKDIQAMWFSRTAERLMTIDRRGHVVAWVWRPTDLIRKVCEMVTRPMTVGEWQRYFDGNPAHTCSTWQKR